jgi:glycosyltransferase involved in cell wall biosynthesis
MFANIKQIWFASQCMETKPDVIIAPSVPITTGWIGYCLSIKYKVPFIYEVRDVWPDALVDIGGLSRRNPAYHIFRLMEKRLYKNAVYVSSTLPFLQDHVKASGADPNKVRYIPNGFDYSLFSKFSQLTNENKSDKNDIVVMYIGGYGLLHDVSTIIKAAQIIQQSGDLRFRFVLIGGGTKKEECVNEAKSYNLNNVEFRDPIPKDQIQEAQNNADILIAATINSKCFRFGLNQNKLIGYLASGRPVIICTNAPENPVTKSGCGFHVDAENPLALVDALKRVAIMSIEERKKLGIRGRSYVENNLSIQKLGSTMEKMLLSAVDEYCQS